MDPYTYILQIDFNKPSLSKMPLTRVNQTIEKLQKDLVFAMNLRMSQFDSKRLMTNRITFACEYILDRNEKMFLEDECLYCVFVGKVVVGKMIVQEKQFIVGRANRCVMALGTTSLIKLYVMSQRI